MSASSGMAPRRRTGDGNVFHDTPSVLVAMYTASVVHDPDALPLKSAQYCRSDGIHCTSMCHGYTPPCVSETVSGDDHAMPSDERRSSTVVAELPHPTRPEFTVHMSHSVALRRTTVGDTA